MQLGGAAVVWLASAAAGVITRESLQQSALHQRQLKVAADAAAQAERAGLAHDLHDIVAHHVSLIAVRAEAAPFATRGSDSQAREAFVEIANDARRALDELRAVLSVLRRSGADPKRAPQPELRDVPGLIDRAARAGDPVTYSGLDTVGEVSPSVGYVLYRVVQEALTNARRHAPGATVHVAMRSSDGVVVATIQNAASAHPEPGRSDPGSGLVAMTERVEALCGTLRAGPIPDGGFAVTARLPLRVTSR